MKRILGIGNALVDILVQIDNETVLEKFELPKGSMQLVDGKKSSEVINGTNHYKQVRFSGGSAANTIHGLSMLGIDTGFIGSIGKDEAGDFFEKDMKTAGVKTFLLRRDNVTGTAVTLITPDSERTFATHLGAAVTLGENDLDPDFFKGFDILYIEGYLIPDMKLVEKACRLAKENSMVTVLDLASYNVVASYLDSFRKIVARYVDILFANETEAEAYTGFSGETALTSISEATDITVFKTGEKGSWIKKGIEKIKIEAIPVKCNDTTGAGDLYAAGFLYGYALGLDLEKCGMIGSLMGGKVIETVGARMDNAKFKEIKYSIDTIIN
jgi:sugar/nucleoside kinase (ribokinase family)